MGLRLILLALLCCGLSTAADKPNVLFIAIDDLNDWTGMLKANPQAKTAHMDKKRNQRSGFWHGRIDELAFFGSALTSERSENLFQLTPSI